MITAQLVSHPLCPYVQRAAIVMAEKGIAFTRSDIDLANKPDWFLRLSPLGKVPLLQIDGQTLFESAPIVEYLEEIAEPKLHPQQPLQRAQHRAWMEFASTLLSDIAVLYRATPEGFDEAWQRVQQRLETLEQALGEGPFFSGNTFHLVDALFASVLRYWEVFDLLVESRLPARLVRLHAWRQALLQRRSVSSAVAPDYPLRLRDFIEALPGSHLGTRLRALHTPLSPAGAAAPR
ncbi:glutathione S-transferase family protein [Pseudomonas sp. BMS12]|uniref:glutathione S-transferase family protein n=1 Tax=Pseudomonas sp. BMS12 TaxID=1796033 RepID=UPI000839DDD4|nr:glutathione S-transferase family protein [Pseudomonas sp. BMS12]